jgi:hypothetical protein
LPSEREGGKVGTEKEIDRETRGTNRGRHRGAFAWVSYLYLSSLEARIGETGRTARAIAAVRCVPSLEIKIRDFSAQTP